MSANQEMRQQAELLREFVHEGCSKDKSDELQQLLACIEAWEQEPQRLEELRRLQEENAKLKENLKKLRAAQQTKDTAYMSSRLRDALRE